jgi:Skp family chaperone for outer membrane proteins
MKTHLLAGAALALSAFAAVPAAAQVNGIGITDPAAVIFSTKALVDAYGKINTTYAAQITQLQQLQQQRDGVIRPFDVDQNGNLDDNELAAAQANAAAVSQMQTLNQSIADAELPINTAQVYAIEQIAQQYSPALQKVIAAKQIKLILKPDSIGYAPPEAVITNQIVAELDKALPTASIEAPAGWQPQQQSVALWQQVQRIIETMSQMRAAQQAQQGQAAPATPPVQGR